ncbi:hypothetical protein [Alkalimarinus coralli]|uniref:hypothetical protein n=1 Tax=Alkalimarinus coralli TaxID=2935863 RepID=UPI00202AD9E0|nr:hypothetical protein [Alkalimarinus coralli]
MSSATISGNRCGHDKNDLKVFREHRNGFINETQKTIRLWASNPFRYLRSARTQRLQKAKRQVRSERREAVASVLCYMMSYSNFATLHLGVVDEGTGKFVRFGCQHMADKTGLSLSRIWQALSDIRKWGYANTIRKSERDTEGELVHTVAVRSISVKLFHELGLFTKFQKFQEKARKKLKKKLNAIQNRISRETFTSYMRDIAAAEGLDSPDDHRNYLKQLAQSLKPQCTN